MDNATPFDFADSGCSREACDVRFMYFSPEDVRSVSVEELTDTIAFDEWGMALDGGLHAPSMGPVTVKAAKKLAAPQCQTCGMEKDCPGHMGHIELAVVLYNPFLLQIMHKLLQQSCLSCKALKVDPNKAQELIRKLKLLQPGSFKACDSKTVLANDMSGRKRSLQSECVADESSSKRLIVEAHPAPGAKDQTTQLWVENLPARGQRENAEYATKLIQDCEVSAVNELRKAEATAKALPANPTSAQTSSYLESSRSEIHKFMKEFPITCAICKKKSAKWRKEGHSQLFVRRPGDNQEALVKPGDVRVVLRQLWTNSGNLLQWLVPGARHLGADIFFLETILIPPNRFRPPPMDVGSRPVLSRQSTHILNIIRENAELRKVLVVPEGGEGGGGNKKVATVGEVEKHIQILQLAVNNMMDSAKSEQNPKMAVGGIRQELEKKAGVFRMKMMGKRVNFAARSVISPDLNIETSEIGIPQYIAEGLMYPEVAAAHNAKYLRGLVERGTKYPGATEVHVPDAAGGKTIKQLKYLQEDARMALAKQLITDIESGKAPMTVFRHLVNGDPLLVNRQPTLHKPGIMAHQARVLRKESTIRMHYSNCNTYNADFDGDEMNLHAPQDPIGRMEALLIASPLRQYLVPTSGKPLRGLIQDHVIAGTMLCARDSYYDEAAVCLFLYHGLNAGFEKLEIPMDEVILRAYIPELYSGGKIFPHGQKHKFHLDIPCILRPRRLWSGKQVMSMVLKSIVAAFGNTSKLKGTGMCGLNLEAKAKTPGDIWNGKMDGNKEENEVLFHNSDLLRGVLDKSAFGASANGIVHLLHETAGGMAVSVYLSSIARLFSLMLQMRGFTCCYADLQLREGTENRRATLVIQSRNTAKKVVETWLKKSDREEFADGTATVEDLSDAAKDLMMKPEVEEMLEGMIIAEMKSNWSSMINECIPVGQVIPFPRNCFSAMVQTGAKGSMVNQSQITCCLGQQELEGRLPPLMATRRSLPCFASHDLAARTRGYISDRFLTGIRPQEFFFHCMAGREGLVDTAVKTSRSGYLQRCLVKHMESLKVAYDLSVRDADGSVIQFLYGDDGIDVTRASYLYNFDVLANNFHLLRPRSEEQLNKLKRDTPVLDMLSADAYKEAQELVSKGEFGQAAARLSQLLHGQANGNSNSVKMDEAARRSIDVVLDQIRAFAAKGSGDLDPGTAILSPAHCFGSTSELHLAKLEKYVAGVVQSKKMKPEDAAAFAEYSKLKFLRCLADPGEAVGVIAAQSMGEPSTQMTLNTFHLAGAGTNVTLGIPRLREIIQTGSKSCATPLMTVPVLQDPSGDRSLAACHAFAQNMQRQFRRITIMDLLARLMIHESQRMVGGQAVWTYQCRFEFMPLKGISKKVSHLSEERIEATMKAQVIRKLQVQLKRIISTGRLASDARSKKASAAAAEEGERVAKGGDGEGGGDNVGDEEGDAPKKKSRKVLGEADKAANQEENADQEDEGGDVPDDMSAASGMYSSDEDGPGKGEDQAEEEGAGEDDAGEGDAGQQTQTKKEPEESDAESGEQQPGVLGDLHSAIESRQLVWHSRLENNVMTVIVTHRYAECPHTLFITDMVSKFCAKAELQDPACDGVKQCHVKEEGDKADKKVMLECEGINLFGLQVLPYGCVDHSSIYTNDISKVLAMYGVEAARASVVFEVKRVFGHYGIEVNWRHLSLIADYMTQGGGLRPFNRHGMAHAPSPFLQMSFETTMGFLTTACQESLSDSMVSPASAICLGQVPPVGTGTVSLLVDLVPLEPKFRQKRQFKW